MKRRYITPATETISLQVESMLASTPFTDNKVEVGNGPADEILSNRKYHSNSIWK